MIGQKRQTWRLFASAGAAVLLATFALFDAPLSAQFPPGPPPGPPRPARAVAPIDLTGNWVSIVTEDWRFRMVTPPKGDYASVPINADGRRIADAWDPAKDEASGNQCKAYGVAAIMRVPTRLRISWQDDNTLKIETDAGTQTRLLRFGDARPPSGSSWQGYSVATWEFAGGRGAPGGRGGARGGAAVDSGLAAPPAGRAGGAPAGAAPGAQTGGRAGTAAGGAQGPPAGGAPGQAAPGGAAPGRGGQAAPGRGGAPQGGSLKVITTHMKAGYLRKNGVPYSESTTLEEHFDKWTEPTGEDWFVVTTIVDDPKYLQQPFITSTHFKKDPSPDRWNPTACKAR